MSDATRYILDTNVLLFDPDALLAFPGAEVIVVPQDAPKSCRSLA